MDSRIFISRKYKVLLVTAFLFFLSVSALGAWLWVAGKLSALFFLVFGLYVLLLGLRLWALTNNPAVTIDGSVISVFRWYRGYRKVDLGSPVDIKIESNQIIFNQDLVYAVVSKFIIGDEPFNKLVEFISVDYA